MCLSGWRIDPLSFIVHCSLGSASQLKGCPGRGFCADVVPHEQSICSRNIHVLIKAWEWRKGQRENRRQRFVQWEGEEERWRRRNRGLLRDLGSLESTRVGSWYRGVQRRR